jgi:hypothetical protein
MSRSPAFLRTSSSPLPPDRRESGCRRIELPASETTTANEPPHDLDLDRDVDIDHFEVDLAPRNVEHPLEIDLDRALPAVDRLPSFGEIEIAIDVDAAPDPDRASPNAAVSGDDVLSAIAAASAVAPARAVVADGRAVEPPREVRNAAILFVVMIAACSIALGVVVAFLFP